MMVLVLRIELKDRTVTVSSVALSPLTDGNALLALARLAVLIDGVLHDAQCS